MSGNLKGDFTGLRRLIDGLQTAVSGGLSTAVAQELGAESLRLIADEFRKEQDPYGEAWAPLKSRKGKILRKTGYMAGHIDAGPQTGGFRVTLRAGYARVHQNGGKVAEHRRAAREARRSQRTGRFTGKTRGKSGKVLPGAFTVLARTQKGYIIPRRAMLPTPSLGGLGPIWTKAFARVTRRVVRDQLGKRQAQGAG